MSQENRPHPPAGPFLPADPTLTRPETGGLPAFLFYFVLTALGTLGALGCFFTAFELDPAPAPMLLLGAVFCAGAVLLWTRRRFRWAWALGALTAWGLLAWRLFPALSQGAIRVVNRVAVCYSQRLNFSLAPLSLPLGPVTDRQYSITLLSLFILALFVLLLSYELVRRGATLSVFCLTGLLLLAPLGFSILPAAWALGALLLFWAFLLLAAPSLHWRRFTREDARLRLPGQIFARPASLLLLPALALVMLGIYRLFPPETYTRPPLADEIRQSLSQAVNLPALLRGGTGSGGSTVDLHALSSRSFTGETVLQVRHEWLTDAPLENSPTRQKDYLKSFVGSVYTGGSWERLSPEDAQTAEDLFEGSGVRGQTLLAALSQDLPNLSVAAPPYEVTVLKRNVDPRSIFIPYGLNPLGTLPEGTAFLQDGAVSSTSLLFGPTEYTLSALALPQGGQWMFSRLYELFTNTAMLSSTFPDPRSAAPATLYQDLMDHTANAPEASAIDLWQVPQESLDLLAPGQARLVTQTQDYTAFVYDHYTQLPEEVRTFARQYLREHGVSPDLRATERNAVVDRVREMLAADCFYTLSPTPVPYDRDFVEYFLQESKEGFCVHFASAAVVLLRASGIPARYAEGYAVPVRSAPGDDDPAWVDVPDYNAHAWVEVYFGGSGWLPVEVTPPGPDAPAAYANATAPSPEEADRALPTPSPSPTPRPTPVPEELATPAPTTAPVSPTPVPGTAEARAQESRSAILGLLLALLGAASPVLLLLGIRWLRLRVRRARFTQRDRNKAALRVYAHLLRLYKANNNLPYGGFAPPEDVTELALRARYSQHVLTREELARMTDLARELERRLEENLSPWQRRKCKYLLALF